MTDSFLRVFRFAWRRFFRFPRGQQESRRLSRSERTFVIPVTPLVGAAAGLLIWAALALAERITGRTAAAILAAAVIPPVMEYLTGERGIRALFTFLRCRERGYGSMRILGAGLDDGGDGPPVLPDKMLIPGVILLFRSCLYALICLRSGMSWFLYTWTGVFLLFAELSLMPGRDTEDVSPVREDGRALHLFCGAGIFLLAGLILREPVTAGIGFFAAWGSARGAAVLQSRAGGEIDRAVMALYGMGAEILLLFLGVLLCG